MHKCKCDNEREALNCKGGIDLGSEAEGVPACDEGVAKAVKGIELRARAEKKPPCYFTTWREKKPHNLDKWSVDMVQKVSDKPIPARTDGYAELSRPPADWDVGRPP